MVLKKITFLNWATYQGDAKRYESTEWLRLQNTLPDHPLWDELDGPELKGLIFIFCFVSRTAHKTGSITTTMKMLAGGARISVETIEKCLTKLIQLEMLSVEDATQAAHSDRTVKSPGIHSDRTVKSPGNDGDNAVHSQLPHCAYDNDHAYDHDPPPQENFSNLENSEKRSYPRAPKLARVKCGNFLEDIPTEAQESLIQHFGRKLVIEELPKCWAKWQSNPKRQDQGNKGGYLNDWMNNADTKKKTKPGASSKPRVEEPLVAICKAGVDLGGSKTLEKAYIPKSQYRNWVKAHKAGRIPEPPPALWSGPS